MSSTIWDLTTLGYFLESHRRLTSVTITSYEVTEKLESHQYRVMEPNPYILVAVHSIFDQRRHKGQLCHTEQDVRCPGGCFRQANCLRKGQNNWELQTLLAKGKAIGRWGRGWWISNVFVSQYVPWRLDALPCDTHGLFTTASNTTSQHSHVHPSGILES
jgi:hypothetical protein